MLKLYYKFNFATEPDFVYMIETDEQDAKYLIVETKAENMRLGDKSIGEIQKIF